MKCEKLAKPKKTTNQIPFTIAIANALAEYNSMNVISWCAVEFPPNLCNIPFDCCCVFVLIWCQRFRIVQFCLVGFFFRLNEGKTYELSGKAVNMKSHESMPMYERTRSHQAQHNRIMIIRQLTGFDFSLIWYAKKWQVLE